MVRPPKIYTHNGKNYSTNCIKLNHEQCCNWFGKCQCGCHTGVWDDTVKELKNRLAREEYENQSDKKREERNSKIRHMRNIGKWDNKPQCGKCGRRDMEKMKLMKKL